jgi:cation:H+ antiporter
VRGGHLILVVASLSLPAIWLRLTGTNLGTVTNTAVFGVAILTAAFLLAWTAEAAEVEVSQGLAVAFVALTAVLPEYAVDMTFAWKAGQDPEFAQYAVANMTGGNRLLIGAAWPMVFFLFWLRMRRHVLQLEHGHAIEVIALAIATVYSFTIPLKGSIELYDTVLLAMLFVGYVYLIARMPSEEPELIGPARSIGTLPRYQRRVAIALLFVYAAAAIFAAAEPFAEGLIHSGTQLGIDEFLLVQWLAPFASEAPEFLFAGILAYRGRATVGMGALLSSKVNQWTLLIGGLPLAYAISSGGLNGLPLDSHQTEEVLLTAAQSAFAVAVLLSLSLNRWEAILLFGLFIVQFVIPNDAIRLIIAGIYILLAIGILIWHHADVPRLWRSARLAVGRMEAPVEAEAARRVER